MSTITSNGVKQEEEEEEIDDDEELFFSDGEDDEEIIQNQNINFGTRLQAPRSTTYSCESLAKLVAVQKIDVEAEYQRDVVWSDAKQSALIDSIYRCYYVPPILFSMQMRKNGEEEAEQIRVCIDGKQRLTSICRFMNNEIPMREPKTGRSFYFAPTGDKIRYLSQAKRDTFSQIQMNCVEYEHLTDEIERDMFQRVQLGVHLSTGEKLSAAKGEWADFARELTKRFNDMAPPVLNPKLKPWHQIVKLDRGKDLLIMGYSCLLYLHTDKPNYVPSALTLEDLFKDRFPPTQSQKKDMIDAISRWAFIANDTSLNTNLKQIRNSTGRLVGLSPMEFMFTLFMCHQFPGADNQELSKMFRDLRRTVRAEHKDVLINKTSETTIRRYLREVERRHPSYLVSPDGSRRRPREEMDEDDANEWLPAGHEYTRRRFN